MNIKFQKTITAFAISALAFAAVLYFFSSEEEYLKSINQWPLSHPDSEDAHHFI